MRYLCLAILFSYFSLADSKPLYRLKGQGNFYHDFETLDVDRWLSRKDWLKSLKYTEKEKREAIERGYREEVGRVITCIGSCRIERGQGGYDLSYRSLIIEGDTIETGKDSYLWVALKNGNMLRLSSLTKLQIPEINLTPKRAHFSMVLVRGFIHHIDRRDDPIFAGDGLIDTDTIIFPLRYKQANLEYYYWRKFKGLSKKRSTREELFNLYRVEKSKADQFNGSDFSREYFIHTAHGDFMVKNTSFMMSFQARDGAYWRHGLVEGTVQPAKVQLRKAKAFEETLLSQKWYVVKRGEVEVKPELDLEFTGEKFIIERGIAVRLVRDHFFNKYFSALFKNLVANKRIATAEQGARIWTDKELDQRIKYYKDYYHFMGRRWIQHADNLGPRMTYIPARYFNQRALQDVVSNLQGLKLRDFPEMKKYNKTQFHFWLHNRMKGSYFPKGVLEP